MRGEKKVHIICVVNEAITVINVLSFSRNCHLPVKAQQGNQKDFPLLTWSDICRGLIPNADQLLQQTIHDIKPVSMVINSRHDRLKREDDIICRFWPSCLLVSCASNRADSRLQNAGSNSRTRAVQWGPGSRLCRSASSSLQTWETWQRPG